MRNLVFLLFMGVVVFFVAGWFLDWYDITGVKNSEGKTSIQFDINRGKIKDDFSKGTQKFNDTLENLKEGNKNDQAQQPPTSSNNKPASGAWSPVR